MVKDRNKGISNITYNHLNLPTQIEFEGTNNKITYLYNSVGQKLKKTLVYSDSIKIVDYLDGFQTEARGSRTPKKRRSHKTNNSEQNYTATLASFDLEILNFQSLTRPFGLKHSVYSAGRLRDFEVDSSNPEEEQVFLTPVTKTEYQYKYNGQEWQDELGLNMYAMDLRQYDPAIGRWVAQDPVTHFDYSPYSAFDNNPVFWADPSGADAVDIGYDRIVDSQDLMGSYHWSGGFQEIENEGDITLKGQNGNTATFKISGSTSYTGNVPFDIEENILLDINSVLEGFNPDNFAIGYTIGFSANAAAALGGEASASLSVIRYFNDTYGGYNYFYIQTELTGYDGGIIGASLINIQGSIFIMSNANPGYSEAGAPASYTVGSATATGLSVDFKAVTGGGANMYAFRSGNWHGVGIGGNVGLLGGQVNYLSAFHSVTMSSTMLNNQKPTRNRSRVDRTINAPANAVSLMQAIYQYTNK